MFSFPNNHTRIERLAIAKYGRRISEGCYRRLLYSRKIQTRRGNVIEAAQWCIRSDDPSNRHKTPKYANAKNANASGRNPRLVANRSNSARDSSNLFSFLAQFSALWQRVQRGDTFARPTLGEKVNTNRNPRVIDSTF